MAEKATFVLVNYANMAHSEVSTKDWLEATKSEGDYEKILSVLLSAKLPVAFSTQGVDLALYEKRNKKLVELIAKNPDITLTRGIYSHTLPSLFPEHLDMQLQLGQKSLESCKAISAVGMLPEFDVYPAAIPLLNSAGWKYLLLNNDVNPVYDYRPNIARLKVEEDLVVLVDHLGNEIRGIVSKGGDLRKKYLGMFRGYAKPKELVDLIARDTDETGKKCPVLTFLTDFEVLIINQNPYSNSYDISSEFFESLAKARERGNVLMAGFDDKVTETLDNHFKDGEVKKVRLSQRQKPKWLLQLDRTGITDRLKAVDIESLQPYFQKVFLAACTSDYLSALYDFAKSSDGVVTRLPVLHDGKEIGEAVKIIGDKNRPAEVEHLVDALETKTQVDKNTKSLSEESQELMSALHEIFALT